MAAVHPGLARRLLSLAATPVLIGMLVASGYAISGALSDVAGFAFVASLAAVPFVMLCLFIGTPVVMLTRHCAVQPVAAAIIGSLIVAVPTAVLMVRAEPVAGLRDGFYTVLDTHHARGTRGWIVEIASTVMELAAVGLPGGAIYWALCGGAWQRTPRDR